MTIATFALAVGFAVVGFAAGRLGEIKRFNDLLGPLRTDLADLHDRFDHWTKRERVRGSRQRVEESQSPALQRVLERQARRFNGVPVQRSEKAPEEGS